MPHPIPGLVRGTDPTIPKQVLESRLKVIDKRRAEIEAFLMQGNDESYRAQELRSELEELGQARLEATEALHPRPKPKPSPGLVALSAEQHKRDIANLRTAIKQQTEQTEWAAQKEEAAGNHRAARLHRMTILEIPQTVCREFGLPLALLAELDEGERYGEAKNSRKAEADGDLRRGPPVPRRRTRHHPETEGTNGD